MSAMADRVGTSLRLDRDLFDRVKAAAAERGYSANHLMERLLADGMDRLIPVEELRLTRDRLADTDGEAPQ